MPAAESLQLYHPMTLQSMPAHEYGSSTRSMLSGLPPLRPNSGQLGPASAIDYSQPRHHMGLYSSPHSAGPSPSSHHHHYMSSDVPLSAPAYPSHHSSQPPNVYPSYSPRLPPAGPPDQPSGYFNDGHSHSGSAPGSGYATPQ
ncbi:hypothetical protein H0H87_010912 [Tephrocybe sp. NHM501043]|nr:hypothetical protein H0H87_010912 [Tephrocybe sp. NHM501043]